MTIIAQARPSDSPYLHSVTQGHTLADGAPIRPAETNWHLVISRYQGQTQAILVGPWRASGTVHYGAEAEILWIRFKLGTFMPHRPTRQFLDSETALPRPSGRTFSLHGDSWELPTFENVETFIRRLARAEVLCFDPLVSEALKGRPPEMSPRTVRHRFLQATGLSQQHIQQVERAQRAVSLLRTGHSILDTVHLAGYYDQPHLTRSLRQYVGFTPHQFVQQMSAAG
jgi:hypothetical protein